jgi:hypothetical protein
MAHLQRIRVEGWKLKNWHAACRMLAEQPGRGQLKFPEYVRLALDDAAEEVFAALGPPKERHLFPDGRPDSGGASGDPEAEDVSGSGSGGAEGD